MHLLWALVPPHDRVVVTGTARPLSLPPPVLRWRSDACRPPPKELPERLDMYIALDSPLPCSGFSVSFCRTYHST